MAKVTRPVMKIYADFSGVEKAIGNLWGVIDAIDDKSYQQSLMDSAFNTAVLTFNQEAAAFAASGAIKHMYEWGAAGINRSDTGVTLNPMSEAARLWEPRMIGSGFNQQLDYDFKPSVVVVPKPTTGETGMSQESISHLSDHVFWNKAMVFESGMTVTIRPSKKFLLIPLYKNRDYPSARPSDYARGYMLQKGPVVMRPGARSAGRFNAYWIAFWEGQGNQILNRVVQEEIETDYEAALKGTNTPGPLHPAIPGEVTKFINRSRAAQKGWATRRAKAAAKKAEAERFAN